MVLSHANNESKVSDKSKPVIIVEAGQFAGTEPVRMMLVFIQELTACEEYAEMTKKIQWVILPCVNPDGMVYGRHVSNFFYSQPFLYNVSYDDIIHLL